MTSRIRRKAGRRPTIAIAKIGRRGGIVGALVIGITLVGTVPAMAGPLNADGSMGNPVFSVHINGPSSPQTRQQCVGQLNNAVKLQYGVYRQDNEGTLPDGKTLAELEQKLDATAPCGTTRPHR